MLLKFQILTPTFVEMLCLRVSENCVAIIVIIIMTQRVFVVVKLISNLWGSCWYVLCLNRMQHD